MAQMLLIMGESGTGKSTSMRNCDPATTAVVNPVEYASYVEYGHRTANHSGWVKGQFMMTISEQELQKIAPKVLENKIKKYLGGLGK